MYSANDSTSSQNYNNQQQWPLNPAAYQNTPNDQIDWAALAQQWIIMKEAGPPVPEQLLTPPPAPKIHAVTKDSSCEGGEAPMEVEKEDDVQKPSWNENSTESWEWNQQQSWGWNSTWSTVPSAPSPVSGASKGPLLPTPSSFNQYSNSNNENSNNYGRTPSEYAGGYWTASGSKVKPHNKRYSKVNVSTRPATSASAIDPIMLDATKRKQLPAWIREGLEKMERDKQKQIEKERTKQEKQETNEKSLFNEKEALEIIKSTVKERERSKFESDGEESPFEGDNGDIGGVSPVNASLTQEELMLKVRRTMTEILLKVTNQEIRAVCKEEFQRQLRRGKASDQRVSAPSGINARGKLGLGMYGDSGSSSENSDDNYEHPKNNSDTELKDAIKRKKADFSKTEREIEARLAAAEKRLDDSRGGTPKADSSDSQVDAKSQGYKTKLNKDLSPKVYKHRKSRRDSSSSSDYSDTGSEGKKGQSNRSRNSSSSESNSKYTKTRRKHVKNRHISRPQDQKRKNKARNSDIKSKYSESSSSKSSSLRSRKSRSKSPESRRKSPRSPERSRHNIYKNYYSKRSRSKSSSGSNCSRSHIRSHRSTSRSRRSRSHSRSERSHRSRSHTRSERSRRSRSGSRSTAQSGKTHSRRRSKSYSPDVSRRRRLRSRSNSRGKRSNRH